MHLTALACVLALIAPPAMAERGHSGNVYLKGLARDVWPDSGLWRAMVCNVNGPDGFLSVCAGAGTNFEVVRSFNRLAVLNLDLSQRRGRWVRVTGGYRNVSQQSNPVARRDLPVRGWVHDGYLCAYVS